MHTQVQVYDELPAGRRLVEEFKTTAKSAIKPGIAETLPVGAAVSGIGQAAVLSTGIGAATEIPASVKADAKRTATEIIKHLQPFFVRHGWIAPR